MSKLKLVLSFFIFAGVLFYLLVFISSEKLRINQSTQEQFENIKDQVGVEKIINADIKQLPRFDMKVLAELFTQPPIRPNCDVSEKKPDVETNKFQKKILSLINKGETFEDICVALTSLGKHMRALCGDTVQEYLFAGRPVIEKSLVDKYNLPSDNTNLEERFGMLPEGDLNDYYEEQWVATGGFTSLLLPSSNDLYDPIEVDFEYFNQLLKRKNIKPTAADLKVFIPLPPPGTNYPEIVKNNLDGIRLVFQDTDFSEAHLYPGLHDQIVQRLMHNQAYDVIRFLVERGLKLDSPLLELNMMDQMMQMSVSLGSELDQQKALEFVAWLEEHSVKPQKLYVEFTSGDSSKLSDYAGQITDYRQRPKLTDKHHNLLKTIGISKEVAETMRSVKEKRDLEYYACMQESRQEFNDYREAKQENIEAFYKWYEYQMKRGFSQRQIFLSLERLDAAFLLYRAKMFKQTHENIPDFSENIDKLIKKIAFAKNFEKTMTEINLELDLDESDLNSQRVLREIVIKLLADDNSKSLKITLDNGIKKDNLKAALFEYIDLNGSYELRKKTLQNFITLDFDFNKVNSSGLSMMHIFVRDKNFEAVKAVLGSTKESAELTSIGATNLNLLDTALLSLNTPSPTNQFNGIDSQDNSPEQGNKQLINFLNYLSNSGYTLDELNRPLWEKLKTKYSDELKDVHLE